MQVEFTEQETNLILRLLDVQVTMNPSQMQQYLALVKGIADKINPKEPETPVIEPQPTAVESK